MDIKSTLLETIQLMIDKSLERSQPKLVLGMVRGIVGDVYSVMINGQQYQLRDGVGCSPTVGGSVWVMCPNGSKNMNDAFIISAKKATKKTSSGSGSGGSGSIDVTGFTESDINKAWDSIFK